MHTVYYSKGIVLDRKDKNTLFVYSIMIFFLSSMYIMNERYEYEIKELNRFIIIQGEKIKYLKIRNPKTKEDLEKSNINLEFVKSNLDQCVKELIELKDVYDQNFKLNTKIIELNSELGY